MKKNEPGTYVYPLFISGVFLALLLCFSGTASAAQPEADKPPLKTQLIDDMKDKIEIVYVIPRPATIHSALESYEFTFTGDITPNFTDSYTSGTQIALNLGARCSDGIMMVFGSQPVDPQDLEKLGAMILKFTEKLGLKEDLQEIDSFKTALKSEDHEKIRHHIDLLFAEAETVLRAKGDNSMAMLVSLGGWMELLYLASDELVRNYQAESSKILSMDYIVDIYIQTLQNLELMVKDSSALSAIAARLPEIKKLMYNPDDQPLPLEKVQTIHAIAANLKQAIETP